MSMVLDGIRVLDWTVGQQGPVATMLLGDMGADVIKLEGPKGEMGREFRITRKTLGGGRNYYFETNNRNKRAIALDLEKKEAREILYALVAKSDVFVQNWRQSVAKRLGADYQTLVKYNPKLIYASASVLGKEGPEGDKPGLDSMGVARSGFMMSVNQPDCPPLYPNIGIGDQLGAIMLAMGIITALLDRARTGLGQELHSSLLGSMILLQGLNITSYLIQGEERTKHDRRKPKNPLFNHYQCADGQWVVLSMNQDARYWHDFCKTTGIEKMEKDPRFDNSANRSQNSEELTAILDRIFATKTRAEWLEKLGENKDFLFTYLNSVPDLASDPQVLANNYFVDFDHPVLGKIKQVAFPVSFSRTPTQIRREAPMHGQHTEEVLMEILGYTWDDIGKLKEKNII